MAKFPLQIFYQKISSIRLLIDALSPSLILTLEGCHLESHILGTVARSKSIPSMVLQYGWPGLVRPGFIDMPFNVMATWGDVFSSLFKQRNSHVKMVPCGRIDHENIRHGTCIAFFLQGPFYISDHRILSDIFDTIELFAKTFSEIIIMVKSHPEFNLIRNIEELRVKYSNIVDASEKDAYSVLSHSMVSISQFSTVLVESPLFGSIPVSYSPVQNYQYFPDLEALGIGFRTHSQRELIDTVEFCLNNYSTLLVRQMKHKNKLFRDCGEAAILNIVNIINGMAR